MGQQGQKPEGHGSKLHETEKQGSEQGVGEARTGPVDTALEGDQREASTGVAAGRESWRPSADPAAGDMGDTDDQVN